MLAELLRRNWNFGFSPYESCMSCETILVEPMGSPWTDHSGSAILPVVGSVSEVIAVSFRTFSPGNARAVCSASFFIDLNRSEKHKPWKWSHGDGSFDSFSVIKADKRDRPRCHPVIIHRPENLLTAKVVRNDEKTMTWHPENRAELIFQQWHEKEHPQNDRIIATNRRFCIILAAHPCYPPKFDCLQPKISCQKRQKLPILTTFCVRAVQL